MPKKRIFDGLIFIQTNDDDYVNPIKKMRFNLENYKPTAKKHGFFSCLFSNKNQNVPEEKNVVTLFCSDYEGVKSVLSFYEELCVIETHKAVEDFNICSEKNENIMVSFGNKNDIYQFIEYLKDNGLIDEKSFMEFEDTFKDVFIKKRSSFDLN